MKKYFVIAGALAALVVPSAALADVTDNKSTNDAQGWCVVNHMQNGFNSDFNGIGHLRSQQSGTEISGQAGNRVPASVCVDGQDRYGPINDNKAAN